MIATGLAGLTITTKNGRKQKRAARPVPAFGADSTAKQRCLHSVVKSVEYSDPPMSLSLGLAVTGFPTTRSPPLASKAVCTATQRRAVSS